MSRLLSWPGFVAIIVVIQAVCVADAVRTGTSYLPGDCVYYAAAAESLVRDGDLNLLNQCFPTGTTMAEAVAALEGPHNSGFFALAADNTLTIKQSPVLSAAATPFFVVLGPPGFLVFNLVVEILLLVGLAVLAGGGPFARGGALLAFVGTGVWRYTVNFSPDLVLCGLLVGGLLAARSGRPLVAGSAAGLAVSLKLYAAVVLLPVPLLAVVAGRRVRPAMLVVAGGLVGLAPGVGFNTWQFGSPLVTGYERQLRIEGGKLGVADHSSRFNTPPAEGLIRLLFDPSFGLLRTAPLWFLWPVAAVGLLAGRVPAPGGRGWVAAAVAVIALNLAVFARYDQAIEGSTYANRYLFPAVLMGFAVMAAAVEGRDLAGRADGGR